MPSVPLLSFSGRSFIVIGMTWNTLIVFMLRVITFHDTRRLENLRQKQYRSAIFPFDAHVYRVGDGYGVLLVVGVYFAVDQRREFRKSHPVVDSLTSTSGETSIMYSLRRFAFLPHQMSRSGIR